MKHSTRAWKPAESAAANARRVLPDIVRVYFKAGRKLDRKSGARGMHGFRLKTKHLRYTLESFIPLYGPGLKRKIDRLRPIQNTLGDLNDCEVLLREMKQGLPDRVFSYVKHRAEEKRKEFLRYWREEFDADGEEAKWLQYLARATRINTRQTEKTES